MGDNDYRDDDSREEGRGSRRGSRSRYRDSQFARARSSCMFCEGKIAHVDYKQVDILQRFLTERGKIRPRRQTGACAKHQRQLSVAVKRARHLALLPFVVEPGPTR